MNAPPAQGPPNVQGWPVAPSPPVAGYHYGYNEAEAERERILGSLTAPGVLNLIAGTLALGWGMLMVVEAVMFGTGAINQQMMPAGPGPPPPTETLIAFCVSFAILSLLTAALQGTAGIMMLRKKGPIRGVGIAAAVVGFLPGTCCVWPVCLGVGIYTLVVVLRAEVKWALEEAG